MPTTATESGQRALKSYHFNFGNSTTGPVGYCACVVAASRAEAVTRLQSLLEEHGSEHMVAQNQGSVEYLQVYFNAAKVTADRIDEEEDLDYRDAHVSESLAKHFDA